MENMKEGKVKEAKGFYFLHVPSPPNWSLSSDWLAGQVEVVAHEHAATSSPCPVSPSRFEGQEYLLESEFASQTKAMLTGFDVRNNLER